MAYKRLAEREIGERDERITINRVLDEIVDTPSGLKFKNHFSSKNGCVSGWYVLY